MFTARYIHHTTREEGGRGFLELAGLVVVAKPPVWRLAHCPTHTISAMCNFFPFKKKKIQTHTPLGSFMQLLAATREKTTWRLCDLEMAATDAN